MGRRLKISRFRTDGTVLIMVVFVVALTSAIVIGILQISTEEIQLMQNHVYAAQALAIAEAGLSDALAELRADPDWDAGLADKPFDGGSYNVVIDGATIVATGTNAQGFAASVEADVAVSLGGPPHIVTVTQVRINQ